MLYIKSIIYLALTLNLEIFHPTDSVTHCMLKEEKWKEREFRWIFMLSRKGSHVCVFHYFSDVQSPVGVLAFTSRKVELGDFCRNKSFYLFRSSYIGAMRRRLIHGKISPTNSCLRVILAFLWTYSQKRNLFSMLIQQRYTVQVFIAPHIKLILYPRLVV